MADPEKLIVRAGMKLPRYTRGRTKPSLWDSDLHNVVLDLVEAFANLEIRGDTDKNALVLSAGKAILLLKARGLVAGVGSSALYRIKSVERNYLICRTWDGATEGDDDVAIQRNYENTWAIGSQTIRGVLWTYSYDNGDYQHRTATGNNGVVEEQYITPDYLVDMPIYASTATPLFNTTGGQPITLKDDNNGGRAWATRET